VNKNKFEPWQKGECQISLNDSDVRDVVSAIGRPKADMAGKFAMRTTDRAIMRFMTIRKGV